MYFGRQHHNHCFCGNEGEYSKHGTGYLCNCDSSTNVGGGVNCVYRLR
jgi:hypothetical protein